MVLPSRLLLSFCLGLGAAHARIVPPTPISYQIALSDKGGSMPANGCGFWDPLGACNAAETAARELLDAIPGITDEIEDAVLNVVDDFMNKLGGVIEKAEAAVLRIEKQSVKNAEALWKNVTDALTATIHKIVDMVQKLIHESVSVITAAIEKIISDVSQLANMIFNRLDDALHDFEQFVWQSLWCAKSARAAYSPTPKPRTLLQDLLLNVRTLAALARESSNR